MRHLYKKTRGKKGFTYQKEKKGFKTIFVFLFIILIIYI